MDFVDSVLVRLADPAARTALFTEASLGHLVEAAFDTEAMPVSTPYSPVFDELRLGFAEPPSAVVEGELLGAGGLERTELRLRLHGLGHTAALRAEAIWRGALVVRTAPMVDRIEMVEVALPSLDVDQQIVAELGSLPTDPQVLEAERRSRVLARMRSGLDQPAGFTENHLDRVLAGVGARSVSDLTVRLRGQAQAGTVQVRFTEPGDVQPSARPLPFAAAILVRDQGFSLAGLLAESRLIRARAQDLGLELPAEAAVRRRARVVVVWMVPEAVFDDDAWPGGTAGTAEQQRAQRFARAGEWLGREGIGLVAVPSI
ncbi:hypothetical protein GCM10027290_18360 [Micromonospora sonneratiae]|uniref:Uncharacterized protein n=1 Tax=Micromonospora sonneratiae TaxID=1184706 RepID=A0ABW3YA18_9ACTN